MRKGYRFKGTASVHTAGDVYDQGLAVLKARGSSLTADRVRSIVVVEVTDAAPMWSPAYDDGSTEEDIAERWVQYYTDLHAQRRS